MLAFSPNSYSTVQTKFHSPDLKILPILQLPSSMQLIESLTFYNLLPSNECVNVHAGFFKIKKCALLFCCMPICHVFSCTFKNQSFQFLTLFFCQVYQTSKTRLKKLPKNLFYMHMHCSFQRLQHNCLTLKHKGLVINLFHH